MPFSNPILGGTALVRPAIKSPNYAAGATGWSINQDGSAELNNVTVRGTVAVVASDGTEVLISASNGTAIVGIDAPGNFDGGAIYAFPATVSGHTIFGLHILSPTPDNGVTTLAQITLFSGFAGALKPQIQLGSGIGDQVLVPVGTQLVTSTGNQVAETWHAMTLLASWVNQGAGDVTAQYRLVASPPNSVEVIGSIKNGTTTNGTVIANLPAGYRPVTVQSIVVFATTTAAQIAIPRMALTPGGDLVIVNCPAAQIIFHGFYSLDA